MALIPPILLGTSRLGSVLPDALAAGSVREAVHEGTHHLREAVQTLSDLRLTQTAVS